MALNSSIHKVNLQISNMDVHYYEQHLLTIAKHPSETDQRLMVRLLVFALYATENLEFVDNISNQDEPALCIKDMTGAFDLWIEVGIVDENKIRKACHKAKKVVLITYGSKADHWWKKNSRDFVKKNNLEVINLPYDATSLLANMVDKKIEITCHIEDGHVLVASDETNVEVVPVILHK